MHTNFLQAYTSHSNTLQVPKCVPLTQGSDLDLTESYKGAKRALQWGLSEIISKCWYYWYKSCTSWYKKVGLNVCDTGNNVALGGLVVACLPLHPRLAGSNLAEDDGFLRVIKIRSTTSFGGEVKSSVPCRFTACKITLRAWKRCFVSKIQRPCFSPMSLLLRY
jgi:hypothetical protein